MEKDYKQLATELRRTVLKMTHKAGSSHIGSNFSSADLFTVLYEIADLTYDANGITKDIIVAKSWNAANMYACLVRKGLLPQEAIDRYGEEGTPWTTILDPITIDGKKPVIFGTGAMGYHLPAAVGFALAKKIKKEDGTVYCLISDGELNIGSTWESLALAAHHKLDNLVLIVDKNGFQAMAPTAEVLDMEPINKKIASFGWDLVEVDGHDYDLIRASLKVSEMRTKDFQGKKRPFAIIAKTIKGKGWKRSENNNLFHYSHVNQEMLEEALSELENA